MSDLLRRVRGAGAPLPPRAPGRHIALAALGGFLAIGLVAGLADLADEALVLGSFGASCVLVFGFADAPFSQPRNVVAGHVLSSLCGLAVFEVTGAEWWAAGVAVGLAIALMMATRTVHPPAGSNPVIVFLGQPDWDFLLFPTLVGAAIVVVVAVLYNGGFRRMDYPRYWIGGGL